MSSKKVNVVTGAFSYTGRYITDILLKRGEEVRNLTNHPSRPHNFGKQVQSFPMNLDDRAALTDALRDAHTLYCTYWVRFNDYHGQTRDTAILRARNLIAAAKDSGVQKIIFTSHTQTSLDSPFAYIRGKAIMEEYIRQSGISYGFAKPCAIFGDSPSESILMNNLAYIVRRFPLLPIIGHGQYPVQAVHVRDLAELCVELANSRENQDRDAVGPEVLTFQELVTTIRDVVGSRCFLFTGVPPEIVYYASKPLDWVLRDKFWEKDDLYLLTNNMLRAGDANAPTGKRKLTEWLYANRATLGKKYLNSTKIYYEPDPTTAAEAQKNNTPASAAK